MWFERAVVGSLLILALASGSALAASQDNDVEWDGIFSDTTGTFVSPFEFDAPDEITVRLRAKQGDLTSVICRFWLSGPDTEERAGMSILETRDGFDYWGVNLLVPDRTTHIYYRFEVTDGSDTDYYDAGAPSDEWSVRGMSDSWRGEDYNFVLVVGFRTPAWSREGVFYQVFPDRFYDGDSSNNTQFPEDCFWYLDYAPALPDAGACASYVVPEPVPGWSKHCEIHDDWSEAPNQGPCDYFGGDLQGVAQQMGYIEGVGATAIYLNPVFRSPSNHKYDTMDYTWVDPRFGDNVAMEELSAVARDRGIKLVLDGVFNHTSDLAKLYNGWFNYAYDSGVATGWDAFPESCGAWEAAFLNDNADNWSDCQSEYSDWFKIWVGTDTWDVDRDGNTSEVAAHTCGWAGFEFMPDIDYKSPANPNSGARVWLYGGASASNQVQARQSIAGMWLADGALIDHGVDGWRLDVPDNAGYFTGSGSQDCSKADNDMSIWEGFRAAVKAVGQDNYIVGELWQDASDNSGRNYAQGVFDGTMDYYYFAMPVSCFVTNVGVHNGNEGDECLGSNSALRESSATSVEALDRHLAAERRAYPASFYLSSLNLLSSHDTARFFSRAGGSYAELKEAVLLQATLPGVPMIYYGDEWAVEGSNNELGRATMPWDGMSLSGTAEQDVYEFTSSLMCVRKAYDALQTGSFITLAVNNSQRTYGFGRFNDTQRIAVAINNDGASHNVALDVGRLGITSGTMLELVSGAEVAVSDGSVSVSVDAKAGAILVTSDMAASGEQCFGETVDLPPIADAGEPFSVTTEDVVVLDGSNSSDPEGRPLEYLWQDQSGNDLGRTAVVTLDPIPVPGNYVFYLTVSDGTSLDSDSVTVTVDELQACSQGPPGVQGALMGLVPFALAGLNLVRVRRRRRSGR